MHSIIEEIQSANAWREGELAKFKLVPPKINESLWIRMCVPMIYAHWEGFVVEALKQLAIFLNDQKLDPKNASIELFVMSFERPYKMLRGNQSHESKIKFTQHLRAGWDGVIKLEKKVNTKSNLRANVLKNLCLQFGLDSNGFEAVERDINTLVDIRNKIAHGENAVCPDMETLGNYIGSVIRAMDILVMAIDDYVEKKTYLAS